MEPSTAICTQYVPKFRQAPRFRPGTSIPPGDTPPCPDRSRYFELTLCAAPLADTGPGRFDLLRALNRPELP